METTTAQNTEEGKSICTFSDVTKDVCVCLLVCKTKIFQLGRATVNYSKS